MKFKSDNNANKIFSFSIYCISFTDKFIFEIVSINSGELYCKSGKFFDICKNSPNCVVLKISFLATHSFKNVLISVCRSTIVSYEDEDLNKLKEPNEGTSGNIFVNSE